MIEMKVSEAIKYLQRYDDDEELIIAWWDKAYFEHLSDEQWDEYCDDVEQKMDWSMAYDTMDFMFESMIKEDSE